MALIPRAARLVRPFGAASIATATSHSAYHHPVPTINLDEKLVSPAIEAHVELTIAKNKVAVFSKSWCPHSERAKNLLKTLYPNLETKVVELDLIPEGGEIQAYLKQKTGQRTVPNIFVGQNHVGGNDAIHALEVSGELSRILRAY